MPLDKSKTKAAFSRNVSELMHANHPQKQALAIAYRIQRGKAEGGEVADPWAQGVRAAETGAIAPSPYGRDTRNMLAMGRAGDDLRNNAPLLMDTAPGRVARAIGRAATGNTPYVGPGLRREDYTDDPEARQPIEPMINDAMNVADVMSLGSLPSVALKGAQRGALGIGVPPKVSDYVKSLEKAEVEAIKSGDRSAFQTILDRIKSDPTIKTQEAHEISKGYGGIPLNKTKKSAFERINENFLERAYQAAKMIQVDKASKFSSGGSVPFFARQGASTLAHSGMIHSTVPGRTDRIGMGVKRNSYVIPADVVSSVGQGNSMAGANAFNHMFKSGPYGASLPSGGGTAKPIRQKFAEGGEVDKPVDIVAAGGEFVVPPEHVERIGGGDMDRGHEILDRMVHHIRKKTIKTLRKLPGPKKS